MTGIKPKGAARVPQVVVHQAASEQRRTAPWLLPVLVSVVSVVASLIVGYVSYKGTVHASNDRTSDFLRQQRQSAYGKLLTDVHSFLKLIDAFAYKYQTSPKPSNRDFFAQVKPQFDQSVGTADDLVDQDISVIEIVGSGEAVTSVHNLRSTINHLRYLDEVQAEVTVLGEGNVSAADIGTDLTLRQVLLKVSVATGSVASAEQAFIAIGRSDVAGS